MVIKWKYHDLIGTKMLLSRGSRGEAPPPPVPDSLPRKAKLHEGLTCAHGACSGWFSQAVS